MSDKNIDINSVLEAIMEAIEEMEEEIKIYMECCNGDIGALRRDLLITAKEDFEPDLWRLKSLSSHLNDVLALHLNRIRSFIILWKGKKHE